MKFKFTYSAILAVVTLLLNMPVQAHQPPPTTPPTPPPPPPPPQICEEVLKITDRVVGSSGKSMSVIVDVFALKRGLLGGMLIHDHSGSLKVLSLGITSYTIVSETTRIAKYNVKINGKPGTAIVTITGDWQPGVGTAFDVHVQLSNGISIGTLSDLNAIYHVKCR